jgi:thymidylate synthase
MFVLRRQTMEELYGKNEIELLEKVFKPLYDKLIVGDTVAGTVELIDAHVTLDPKYKFLDFPAKKAPRKYQQKELDWYTSKSLSIHPHVEDVEIWKNVATPDGHVNSNYGWMVFSPENGDGVKSQYEYAIEQLRVHPDGRQSVIFYNRPSMQWEWNDGKHASHDFTCTFSTWHGIRNNKLEYILYMRSNDAWFGLVNDFRWACEVYENMFHGYRSVTGIDIEYGSIHWNACSLHVYERHYDLLKRVVEDYESWKNQ